MFLLKFLEIYLLIYFYGNEEIFKLIRFLLSKSVLEKIHWLGISVLKIVFLLQKQERWDHQRKQRLKNEYIVKKRGYSH